MMRVARRRARLARFDFELEFGYGGTNDGGLVWERGAGIKIKIMIMIMIMIESENEKWAIL